MKDSFIREINGGRNERKVENDSYKICFQSYAFMCSTAFVLLLKL